MQASCHETRGMVSRIHDSESNAYTLAGKPSVVIFIRQMFCTRVCRCILRILNGRSTYCRTYLHNTFSLEEFVVESLNVSYNKENTVVLLLVSFHDFVSRFCRTREFSPTDPITVYLKYGENISATWCICKSIFAFQNVCCDSVVGPVMLHHELSSSCNVK